MVEPGIDGPRSRSLTARKFEAMPERLARARYLANGVTGCIHCHLEHDWRALGGPSIKAKLGAGQVFPESDLPGVVMAPKPTPDLGNGRGNLERRSIGESYTRRNWPRRKHLVPSHAK